MWLAWRTWLGPVRRVAAALALTSRAMPSRAELERLAGVASERRNVPPALLRGLVQQESAWNPGAIRREPKADADPITPGIQADSSRGLGQLLYRTARSIGYMGTPAGLFDPATNLDLAARYLALQYQAFGSWPAALAAYNGGPRAGRPVSVPTVTVLARDSTTGAPIRSFTARPGQFRNQPYVDSVLRKARSYGYLAPSGGVAGSLGPLVGALALVALVATLRRAP